MSLIALVPTNTLGMLEVYLHDDGWRWALEVYLHDDGWRYIGVFSPESRWLYFTDAATNELRRSAITNIQHQVELIATRVPYRLGWETLTELVESLRDDKIGKGQEFDILDTLI